VLDDLTKDASITSANDQNLLGAWMRVHGQMSDHLLVGKLITLGALDDVVENENSAIVGRFEDENVLVFAFLVVDDILDLQSHGLARPHVRDLAEPAILDGGVSNFRHGV
jgi:hypothetical protein